MSTNPSSDDPIDTFTETASDEKVLPPPTTSQPAVPSSSCSGSDSEVHLRPFEGTPQGPSEPSAPSGCSTSSPLSPSKIRKSKSPSPKEVIKKIIEFPARILGMKKAAKSGNKQKQKEVNAECDKLEKEQEDRHRQELEADQNANKLKKDVQAVGPATGAPEDTEGGSGGEEGSNFYKNVNISNKAAKKQAKKKEQEEKMKAAAAKDEEAAAKQDSEKHSEKVSLKAVLAKHNLKMVDIIADGDCMYSAISHQLMEEGKDISARKLRRFCAKYMREHRDDFFPFIADTDFVDEKKEADWECYLIGVERSSEQGGVWGGELELKALSMLYEKAIVIYKIEGGSHTIGAEFLTPQNRALRIVYLQHAYTLGEHYNSTSAY